MCVRQTTDRTIECVNEKQREINIQAIKVPFHAVGNEMNIECILQKHKVEISCISDYLSVSHSLSVCFTYSKVHSSFRNDFGFVKEEMKPI